MVHIHCIQALVSLLEYTTATLLHMLVLHQEALAHLSAHILPRTCEALAVHTHCTHMPLTTEPSQCSHTCCTWTQKPTRMDQLRGEGAAADWTAQSPPSLPSVLTWIQGGSSLRQQAEVHLAQMNSVVERREEHSPGSHYTSHQQVDGEEKESGYEEHAPVGKEEKG